MPTAEVPVQNSIQWLAKLNWPIVLYANSIIIAANFLASLAYQSHFIQVLRLASFVSTGSPLIGRFLGPRKNRTLIEIRPIRRVFMV